VWRNRHRSRCSNRSKGIHRCKHGPRYAGSVTQKTLRDAVFPSRPFQYSRRTLQCDGVSLESLAGKFGTPLYVYSAEGVRQRLQMFATELADVRHTVCYAVKANSNLSLLGLMASHGAGFDIVSGGELERVLRASKKAAARVVFSGVGKSAEEMDFALRAGIRIFNVESEAELDLLASRAAKQRKAAKIALRVNPDVFAETHPYISTGLREHKFGIDIQAARAIYLRAAKSKWLRPVGVSVHIGSQICNVEPFRAALLRVHELVRELALDGIEIESVDAGGGLGIEYDASKPFDAAGQMRAYAGVLKSAMAGFRGELLLEPGRFIIAQAGALLTRVLYVKNDLVRPSLYQAHHEIVPVALEKKPVLQVADVVGPVCETGDFFARDREMVVARPGNLLAILDAGAYGMSLSSNYNSRPRAAEVMVDSGRTKLVRRRETLKEMLAAERV
jgi:diaminopimelate decarboxylase